MKAITGHSFNENLPMELAHDTTTQEYVEVIRDLERANRVARVKDIAERRGVTRSSVSLVLNQLIKKELISHEQYGHVTLTENGQQLASILEQRHQILKDFLTRALGISEIVAENDACRFEHEVSEETLAAITAFLDFMGKCPHVVESSIYYFQQCAKYGKGTLTCSSCDSQAQPRKRKARS
jgi:DtxR family Mn-dependent transcriptional regulator